MRVNLTDGNWADLRDKEDLFEDDRRAVARRAVIEYNPDTKSRTMRGDIDGEMADALLERLVEAWSFPFKVPSKDPRALGKLRIGQARELREHLTPYFKIINGDTADSEDEVNPTTSEN